MFKYWRIWDGKKKKMHYPSEDTILKIFDGGIGWGLYESHEGGARLVSGEYKECILMPWSGLQDREGHKIYLDDIIEFNGFKYRVVYENGKFSIYITRYNSESAWNEFVYNLVNFGVVLSDYNTSCEIVGNTYQNKKLIP